MTYCASDVLATRKMAAEVFPLFRQRCPHPATLAGMLEMSTARLPVDRERWSRFVARADSMCAEAEEEVEGVLGRMAKEACQLMAEEAYRSAFHPSETLLLRLTEGPHITRVEAMLGCGIKTGLPRDSSSRRPLPRKPRRLCTLPIRTVTILD